MLNVESYEQLVEAASAGGPGSTEPPHVRLPFPMVALPGVLRRFVSDAAEVMGVPPECVATPAIATCATAIGNTCRIRLQPTWLEPAVIWAVTLMESGSLKTPAYNAAVEPLREAQRFAEETFQSKQKAFKEAAQQHEAEQAYWNAQAAQNGQAGPPAPVEPKPEDLFTSDSTVEALAILFANNPRGLALTRDELSGFFGSFGAYKGGRGGDEATYLEFYNAGALKLNRASGKRIYVHSAALSIFGTCQPAVFAAAIGANGRATNQVENGMAARFIITAPETTPKRWREAKPYDPRPYCKMIAGLLTIPLVKHADGRVEPAIIQMTPQAKDRFRTFVNEHGKQRADIALPALRFHYAKLEAVAARFALIFYLCEVASEEYTGAPCVQEHHVLGGIALARWYGREAARVYASFEGTTDWEKRELLDKIRDLGGRITPRQMRSMRSRWIDPSAAETALRDLERAGLGECGIEPSGPHGGRPSFRFKLYDHAPITEAPGNPEILGDTANEEVPPLEAPYAEV